MIVNPIRSPFSRHQYAVMAVILTVGFITFSDALFLAAYADDYTPAGPFVLDNSTPVSPPLTAHVNQTVQVVTTNMNFGTIGIHQDKGGGRAALTLSPGGSLTDSHNNANARIVALNGSAGVTVATVSVQGAFPNTVIYDHYQNIIDLTCASGTCTEPMLEQGGTMSAYSSPKLLITNIVDDLNHLGSAGDQGTAISSGSWSAGGATIDGQGRTNNGGTLRFAIGATISTDGASQYYASGLYSGSFDITLSY